MKASITALSALAIATTLAFAQDKPAGPPKGPGGPGGPGRRPPPAAVFKKLDANGDGNLTLDEFKASPRAKGDGAKAEEIFAKIDKDNSGGISLEEFKAHRPAQRPGGPGKGGPGKGGPVKGHQTAPEAPAEPAAE